LHHDHPAMRDDLVLIEDPASSAAVRVRGYASMRIFAT
jgi:hypothetical protein